MANRKDLINGLEATGEVNDLHIGIVAMFSGARLCVHKFYTRELPLTNFQTGRVKGVHYVAILKLAKGDSVIVPFDNPRNRAPFDYRGCGMFLRLKSADDGKDYAKHKWQASVEWECFSGKLRLALPENRISFRDDIIGCKIAFEVSSYNWSRGKAPSCLEQLEAWPSCPSCLSEDSLVSK